MCVWIRPLGHQSSSSPPPADLLCPPCLSAYHHVLNCAPPHPPSQMSAFFEPSGPWATTCKGRIGISCPPTESKLSLQQWCKEPPHHIVHPQPLLFSPNFLYLILLPSVPCVGVSRRENSPTAGGFKSGGQPCICVSKVRLPCRMLSFSGRWLWGERDDSTSPRGWCVKRYGKTRINRGPGILPDWIWPQLLAHPTGEIQPQARGWNQALVLILLLFRLHRGVLSFYQCLSVVFGDLCSIWGN